MRLTLVTPPQAFITVDEARQQCRAEDEGETNAVLERAIDAAISYLDGYRGILRRCIVDQQWRMDLAHPGRTARLPFPDIKDVTVAYGDIAAGAVPFEMCCDGIALNFGIRPVRPVAVTFTAGFGNVHEVPVAIKQAGLMLVNFFYNHRGGDSDGPAFPPEVDAMVSQFKVWRI